MIQILIFGTGVSAEKILLNIIQENANVIGFLDNNKKRQGQKLHGKDILSPLECKKIDFDYIIIASGQYEMIQQQLLEIGIEKKKIIPYFAFCHEDYGWYSEFIRIEGMVYDEITKRLDSMDKYIKNMEYEIADRISKKTIEFPKVKTIDETIQVLKEKRLSISRYGDGEFDIIEGKDLKFQNADSGMAERLKEILVKPVDNHIVGLADVYGDLSQLDTKYANFFREFLIHGREMHYKYIDMNRTYYNAFISRLYSEMKDKSKASVWFEQVKEIWAGRDVVIVEGDKTRFGVGNNLMEQTTSIKRILAPNENAYSKYEDILNCCLKMEKHELFLLALGPTATVLAYDLAKAGYQAIDIGHFDIEYEWFLKHISEDKVAVEGKYTNEVVGGDVVADITDQKYLDEIVENLS